MPERLSLKRPSLTALSSLALISALALGGGSGCSSGDPASTAGNDDAGAACVSTRDFFVRDVWTATLGSKCIQCHMPDGVAVEESHARFVLQPPSYPGFLDENLAMVRKMAAIKSDGESLLLLKPLGQVGHGGGVQLDADGPEAKALRTLLERLDQPEACARPTTDLLANVVPLDPAATLRKATIDLANRLPTPEEKAAVTTGGEAALDAALDGIMHEDAFFERIRDMFGDLLLVDKLTHNAPALNTLTWNDWPGVKPYNDGNSPLFGDPKTAYINRALAREPLDLIAYVVRNEKPFTEILTADYTVVNPFSAIAYGLDSQIQFTDPIDEHEYHEAHVAQVNGPLPQAGVLAMPAFLIRWPSTTSNVNRGRARRVLQAFLGTDIQDIISRPINVAQADQSSNPTRTTQACTVCHSTVDPVAGAFRGFANNFWYASWDPAAPWHDEMFAPGFNGTPMPTEYNTKGPQWLGRQLVADPRFGISMVRTVYAGLTGRTPLSLPRDTKSEDYPARLAAWETQDAYLAKVTKDFVASGWNLKTVVRALVKSPYYRGAGLSDAVRPEDEKSYAELGIGQMLTPEALDRKLTLLTGFHWRQPWHDVDKVTNKDRYFNWLTGSYHSGYGGIDYDTIIKHATQPNGIMVNIVARMANEVTCHTAVREFGRLAADRRLFPRVEPSDVPVVDGAPAPDAVKHIRANIQYLHELLLGETLAEDDPEIDRTFSLFLSTWHELDDAKVDGAFPWPCGVTPTGEPDDVPSPVKFDTFHTIRAWMAVESYLLNDWKFIHQ